ncbi:MAG: 2-oxo acid dehydrogenase subunit E2 [Elusimicrobiota bacterium]
MPDEPLAVRVPRENVNDETVKLANWLAADRQKIRAGEVVVALETSKAVVEVPAPEAGFIRYEHPEGAEIAVGEILFYVVADPAAPLPARTAGAPSAAPVDGESTARFSAKARALVDEHGLDPADFSGRGLVRESDVRKFLAARGPAKASFETSRAAAKREPLTKRKLTEIRHLAAGQNAGLASSVGFAYSMEGLRRAAARRPDGGGTPMPIILHEIARLLRKHPVFNAYFEDDAVHYYSAVNIGLVIDAGRGLKAPVIRGVDEKTPLDVAREMQDLMLRYLSDEIDAAALAGGTFTISDLTAEGAFVVAPLINYRQSAILAMGVGQFTLVFDHRLTEGRAAAVFLRELIAALRRHEETGA